VRNEAKNETNSTYDASGRPGEGSEVERTSGVEADLFPLHQGSELLVVDGA